jgi:TolB-like protein
MRATFLIVFAAAILLALSSAPAQTTTTNPLSREANAPASELSDGTVLVLPIADPLTGDHRGIGRAIQQDIVTDLGSVTQAHALAPASAMAASEDAAAISQARQNNARYVIWGQAQISGNQLRVTGQLMDATDNRSLAALKATAPIDNLFPLEDSLAVQAARALPAPIGMPQPPQTQPAAPPPDVPQPVPQTANEPYISVSPTEPTAPYYSYTEQIPPTYYVYNQYYAYPGYWYPYWGWYGGIGFAYGWPYHYHGWYYPHYYGWYHGGYYRGGWGHRGGTVVIPHGGGAGGFRGGAGGGFHGGGGGGAHR